MPPPTCPNEYQRQLTLIWAHEEWMNSLEVPTQAVAFMAGFWSRCGGIWKWYEKVDPPMEAPLSPGYSGVVCDGMVPCDDPDATDPVTLWAIGSGFPKYVYFTTLGGTRLKALVDAGQVAVPMDCQETEAEVQLNWNPTFTI